MRAWFKLLSMSSCATLLSGDPAPWFRRRCTTPQGSYTFDMAAGRYFVLFFFASSREADTSADLAAVDAERALFDGNKIGFFGVSADAQNETEGRLSARTPGIRFFWDGDGAVGRLYGARPQDEEAARPEARILGPRWVLLDPMLRVLRMVEQAPGAAVQVIAALHRLASLAAYGPDAAPVLLLEGVPQIRRRSSSSRCASNG